MKRLLRKSLFFIIPLVTLILLEGFLPPQTYTYRPWEALRYQTIFGFERKFHPNSSVDMKSVGQLCHHTKNAVKQKEVWVTDEMGNRNDYFIEDPDILIIGDSNVAGCCVSQDAILSNQLSSALDNQLKVYSISPSDFADVDYYLKNSIITKPKLIIYVKSERYLPAPLVPHKPQNSKKIQLLRKIHHYPFYEDFSIVADKIFRKYSLNWIKARVTQTIGDGLPGINENNMHFFDIKTQEGKIFVSKGLEDIDKILNTILSYQNFCDSLGTNFLYLPIPKKETIYYDYVPFEKQPDEFLVKLDSMLEMNNIATLNTLNVFNDYRKSNSELLFHLDDTHMNAEGMRVLSTGLAHSLKDKHQYLSQK